MYSERAVNGLISLTTFLPGKQFIHNFSAGEIKNIFQKLNNKLSRRLRTLLGRNEDASVGIVDSQSVKTTEKKGSADLTEVKKLKVGNDIYWWITLDC